MRKFAEGWHRLLKAVCLVPLLFSVILVWRYGVDIPVQDQWFISQLFTSPPSLQYFLSQHNEHRILFPRLFWFALGQPTHWNIHAEMFISIFFSALSSWGLLLLVKRTSALSGLARYFFWGILNFILFLPVQSPNWFRSDQLAIFLPICCLIWIAVDAHSSSGLGLRLLRGALYSIVATFCFGNGSMFWPICLGVNLIRDKWKAQSRKPIAPIICFGLVGLITIFSYFHGYEKPAHHPSLGVTFERPVDALVYFFSLFGRPWQHDPTQAFAFFSGLAVVSICLISLGAAIGSRDKIAGWLGIAAYCLASALLNSLGRVGFGLRHALVGYYTTHFLLLPLAAFGAALAWIPLQRSKQIISKNKWSRTWPVFVGSLGFVLILVFVHSAQNAIRDAEELQRRLLAAKAGVHWINYLHDPEPLAILGSTQIIGVIRDQANALSHSGYLLPPVAFSNEIDRNNPAVSLCSGSIDSVQIVGTGIVANGWARHGERSSPAEAVVLTTGTTDRNERVRGIAIVGDDRPDVVKGTREPALENSGWHGRIMLEPKEEGTMRVAAWAYDTDTGMVSRICGSKEVRLAGSL